MIAHNCIIELMEIKTTNVFYLKYSVKYWLFNFCGIIKVIEAS